MNKKKIIIIGLVVPGIWLRPSSIAGAGIGRLPLMQTPAPTQLTPANKAGGAAAFADGAGPNQSVCLCLPRRKPPGK